MDLRTILLVGALPACTCLVFLVVAWYIRSRRGGKRLDYGYLVLSYALPFMLFSGLQFGWPRVPPSESWKWLIYVSALAIATSFIPKIRWARIAGDGVAALAVSWLVIPSRQEPTLGWIVLLALTIATMQASLQPLAGRWRGMGLPLVLLLTAVSGSIVLFKSGNLEFAQLAAIFASCCFGAILAAWIVRPINPAGGAVATGCLLLPGLMFCGYFDSEYSPVPWICFFLVMPAPIIAWIGENSLIRRRPLWQNLSLRIIGTLVPLIVACVLAFRDTGDAYQ